MGKLSYAAECQERAEAQRGGRVGINQSITNEQAVFIMLEHHLFLQDDSTHTVESCWNFVTVELTNVLVTFRAEIIALILVQAQIKLGTMLNNCHIETREQHMILIVQFGNRYNEQSMILSSVTVNNGAARIGTRAVGTKQLARQRILQVRHRSFLEFQITHSYSIKVLLDDCLFIIISQYKSCVFISTT